jgi:uncharacterized protein
MSEILELIKTGNNNLLREKMESDPSLATSKTEQGISVLQYAAYYRNKEAIDIIRNYHTGLDIHEAATIGDQELVHRLAGRDTAKINAYSNDGFTVLGLAAYFGHTQLVKSLLAAGADPNIASNNPLKVTPLHSACAISNNEAAELLIKHGADVNAKQMQGVTPLHSAAHNGRTTLVQLLIDNGADPNAAMDNGQTPLFMAEEKNFKETAELIKKYAGQTR